MHLDLKGLPPTSKRLLQLPRMVKAMGYNCMLVEYNVMFPWSRKEFRNKTAYSEATISSFLEKAENNDIEIIPLAQSLGHLEIVGGLKKFAHLREIQNDPAELCPTNPGSLKIVSGMVADVLKLHRGRIRHFHLGGDEAWNLGSCPRCRKFIARLGAQGRALLFLRQIEPLLDQINAEGVRPILWADMMREWPVAALRRLAGKTDLMEWGYGPNQFETGPQNRTIPIFREAGIPLWGASAFKGGDGCTSDRPNIPNKIANNLGWARKAHAERMKGVIATGWSKGDDFCAHSEGLESSLDSLAIAGAILWDGRAPKHPEQAARAFLLKGALKTICGKRALSIIDAAISLKNWQQHFDPQIRWLLCQYPFNGEKGHFGFQRDIFLDWFDNYVKDGARRLAHWRKLYQGLAPEPWLEIYITNRLTPMRMFSEFFRSVCPPTKSLR